MIPSRFGQATRRMVARGLWFGAAAVAAFAASIALAEGYLRIAPPEEIRPYIGDEAGLAGPYRADPVYTLAYRDADAFRAENAVRLAQLAPLFEPGYDRPVWAFFGNSFVQAPGMLADTVRTHVADRSVFHLGQNTPLPIRFAQVELLLDLGLRPERIFLSIMPVDVAIIGRFPLDHVRVTARGALAYEPRLPQGLAGWLVRSSRIAFAGWVRSNNHRPERGFSLEATRHTIGDRLLDDLLALFTPLAEATHAAGVPVTVLLIPDEAQIADAAAMGFQDTLAARLGALGLDVFDPRADLLAVAGRDGLFLPDGHYAAAGNEILFGALMRHLGRSGS